MIADQTGSGGTDGNAGAGSLLVNGAGTVQLSAANTYTGGTTLSSGTLGLANTHAAGSGAITFANSSMATLLVGLGDTPSNIIAGFAQGETIDLAGIGLATSKTLGAGNVLTVSGGSSGPVMLNFDPNQNFAGLAFQLTTDNNGGTDVTLAPGGPPSFTLLPFVAAANVRATIATAIPGSPNETLSLAVIQPPPSGSLVLQGSSVQFTPSSIPLTPASFSFELKDQDGDVSPVATVIYAGNSNNTITGSASGNTDVALGNGNDNVTLAGNGNVVDAGNGVDSVSGGASSNTIILGNGVDKVTLSGGSNTITLGNGADTVTLGGGGNTVKLGNGADTVSVGGSGSQITLGNGSDKVNGGSGDTITLTGKNGKLALHGSSETVFVNGTGTSIDDLSQGMTLVLSGSPGALSLSDFASDATGVVDLRGGIGGFTTPQDVVAALTSDGHGGTLLSFGTAGSLDFVNTAATQLTANHFAIG